MDWVQWYLAVVWSFSAAVHIILDGKPKEEAYWSTRMFVLGSLICLPYYGRVFGWW